MSTRAAVAVAISAVVLLASVGPVAGVAGDATVERVDSGSLDRAPGELAQSVSGDELAQSVSGDELAQYKVSLNNVTIETWLLRDSTVLNATVEEVVVRNATTTAGSRTNVTLTNVTVGQFGLDRARLLNVTARKLVIRNKSVLSVPGGGLIDPGIENRTLERHWTKNATVSGVVIDRIVVDAAFLCANATLGTEATGNGSFDPTMGEEKPDVTVQNGTVKEALVMQGQATNWSVESVDQSGLSNASLPQSCSRG